TTVVLGAAAVLACTPSPGPTRAGASAASEATRSSEPAGPNPDSSSAELASAAAAEPSSRAADPRAPVSSEARMPPPVPPSSSAPPELPPDMILVPAGPFTMGADQGGQEDERPAHVVTLGAFWLDKTEVTNEDYERCVAAQVCRPHDPESSERNHLGA